MPRNPASQTNKPKPIRNPLPSVPMAETEPEPIDAPAAVAVAAPEPPPPNVKPAKRKPPTPKPNALLVAEVGRQRKLAEAIEGLVFRRNLLLAAGEDLSPDEFRLLETAFPRSSSEDPAIWRGNFDKHLRHEDSRVQRVLSLQEAAGTPADRTAAAKLATETAASLADQAPEIESKIRELQGELDALRQAASDARTASELRHEAVKNLQDKKLLPQFVHDELNAAHHRDMRAFGKALLDLETRRTQIQGMLALDVTTPAGLEVAKLHTSGNARFGVDEFERREWMFHCTTSKVGINTAFTTGAIRQDRWGEYLDELRVDLVGVEARIAVIVDGAQATADAEIVKLKSFYVPA